jgi:hypothetical protein
MIHYQLACDQDHTFEGWFRNSEAFDQQARRKLVICPACGSAKVGKAPMAPSVTHKGAKKRTERLANLQKETVAQLGQLREFIETNFEDVGHDFAESARKIHYGETESRSIYGEASEEEAEVLEEEGILFGRIPWARSKPI